MSKYDITAVENRMYNYVLYKAQKNKSTDNTYQCSLTRNEIIDNIIKSKSEQTIQEIEKVLDVLQSTKLVFWEQKDNINIKKDYNLIVGREYKAEKDEWIIVMSEVIYEHLKKYYELSKCYAPLDLEITSKFKSFYSQRMYELLRLWSRYNKEIEHKFSIEELRFVLGVDNKYPRFNNFKQKVLNVCQKELELYANMKVEFIEERKSNKVNNVTIKILDGEPKKYFRSYKIDELRYIDTEKLSPETINKVNELIVELEENSQIYTQDVFESKIALMKNYINEEIARLKSIEANFEKVTFARFITEYELDLNDISVKLKILDVIDKTITNTDTDKIYAKNYNYFKTVLKQIGINEIKIEDVSCDDEEKSNFEINRELNLKPEEAEADLNEKADIKIEIIKQFLQIKFSETEYKTWFEKGIEKAYISNDILYFVYTDEFIKTVIENRFIEKVKEIIKVCDIHSIKFEEDKASFE